MFTWQYPTLAAELSPIVQFDLCELWPQSLLCSWQEGNPVWSSAAVAGLCCFAFRDALLYILVVTSGYSSYSHCALTSVINKTFLIRQHVVQKNPRRSTVWSTQILAPLDMSRSKSLKSQLVPILILGLNFVLTMSIYPNTSSCCHSW